MNIGEIFNDKWKINSIIGMGAYAKVYLATDEHLYKQVVIKEYKNIINNRYQFIIRNEVNILSELKHSGIPQIYDIVENDSNLIIIMEYIQGKTIDRIIQENSPFTENHAINVSKQLIYIMRYLHSKNIIYRDLKPSNIMITNDNKVVLVDFGTTMVQTSQETESNICVGTIGYAAPEQFDKNKKPNFWTDIYGFGATLYYMLTGVNPTNIHSFSLKEINSNFSNALEFIVLKCTQINPMDRYQNFNQLLIHFKNIKSLNKSLRIKWSVKKMLKNKNIANEKKDILNKSFPTYNLPISKLDETIILLDNSLDIMPPPILDIQNINIFLSYCNFDNDLADIIFDKLSKYSHIHINRYTINVPYKGSFTEFMNTLKKHDKVIMIISDKYLKSRACMYEAGQLLNSVNYQKKILFVICNNNDKKYYKVKTEENIEAQIYDPHSRNQYIIYWENQYNLLKNDLEVIEDECSKIETLEIMRNIKKIISHEIGPFMKYLGDARGISFDELYQHNFKEFLDELDITQ